VSQPKPNLFIIGAMKSGTTSLHAYLAQHPEIFMCEPKEPSWFLTREQLRQWYPSMEEQGFWESQERYLQLFADAGTRKVVGESSTSYTKLPQIDGVVERLARFNPKARFIYIMRDPVERTISHYWHFVRNRDERRDILSAVREESHYRDVSNYAMQLKPYLDLAGSDRLLILTTEELRRDPALLVRRVFQWLGVDESFVPPGVGRPEHVTPDIIDQAWGWTGFHSLRRSRAYRLVRSVVPPAMRSIATGLTRRPVTRRDVQLDAVVAYLRPIQRDETMALSSLFGREFPEWTTLFGSTP